MSDHSPTGYWVHYRTVAADDNFRHVEIDTFPIFAVIDGKPYILDEDGQVTSIRAHLAALNSVNRMFDKDSGIHTKTHLTVTRHADPEQE